MARGYDDYEYIDLKETTVMGLLASFIPITAYVSDIDYKISSFYFTIGGDLMSVDYFCPFCSSADAMQPLQNVMQTLQISENANTASSLPLPPQAVPGSGRLWRGYV